MSMKRFFAPVVVSVLTILCLNADVAYAAKSAGITPGSCAAQGGTYSRQGGTTTCTTTGPVVLGAPTGVTSVQSPNEPAPAFARTEGYYTRYYHTYATTQNTTTCTQQGHQTPTCSTVLTTGSVTTSDGSYDCVFTEYYPVNGTYYYGFVYPRPISECAARGL